MKQLKWFAMRAPYFQEFKAAEAFEKYGMEYFLPVEDKDLKSTDEGVVSRSKLLITNLIFVHTTELEILEFKKRYNRMVQFITRPVGGKIEKLCVPDYQMDAFIKVWENAHEKIVLTDDQLSQLRENARVRILDGMYAGYEGHYQQVKGCGRKKVFVVKIGMLCGCATVPVECTQMQFL